jgi:phosphatidylinositol alpha-mannosyltransferase
MIREVATGLIADGVRPTLITSHRGRPSRAAEEGMVVIRNWRPPTGERFERRVEDHLTHVPFSYLSLRRGSFDIAHAEYPTDALAAARWTRRTGRPSILHFHGIPDERGLRLKRLTFATTRRAVEGCSAVVCSSETSAAAFRRTLGVDARVVHPGVDLGTFAPGAGRAPEPTIFCAAAPDEPRKRIPLLVAAHELVRRERPGARLALLRPRDARLAAELSATEGVDLVDPVEEAARLAELYRRAWVSALPSVGDSFGIVLVESLACGVPVVASDADALPEVVDRDTIGRLFSGDEHSLARALLDALELAEDPRTAAECRRRAEDFSLERCVEAHEALYADLLAERA